MVCIRVALAALANFLLWSGVALADSSSGVGPCPTDQAGSQPSVKVPNDLLKRLNHMGQAPQPSATGGLPYASVQARAYFDIQGSVNDPKVAVIPLNLNSQAPAVFEQLFSSLQTEARANSPTLFQDFTAMLASDASKYNLTTADKLVLLELFGQAFQGQYKAPANITSATPPGQIIQSWLLSLQQGGVCRDIHDTLGLIASTLGFGSARNTGSTEISGNWGTGPHDIEVYKDPANGDYYIQNYGVIVDSHVKDLSALLNYQTRMLQGVDEAKYVNTVDNSGQSHMHVIESGYAEQAWKVIASVSGPHDDGKAVHVDANLGNLSSLASISAGMKALNGDAYLTGFATRDDNRVNPEDPVTTGAYGGAAGVDHDITHDGKVLANTYADIAVGKVTMDFTGYDPNNLNNAVNPVAVQYPMSFYKTDFGLAVPITSRMDVNAGFATRSLTPGATLSDQYAYLGAGYQLSTSSRVDLTRALHHEPESSVNLAQVMKTDYDRVSFFYDAAKGDVHLTINGRVYLFEGADKLSAVGLYDLFKATIPANKFGDFVVYGSMGKVLDRSGDPWYAVPLTASAGVQWVKKYFDGRLRLTAYENFTLDGHQELQDFRQDQVRVPATATFTSGDGPEPIPGDPVSKNQAGLLFRFGW